ncbi:hypothetical protein [Vibrio vulnificus]|uniref:hypothetical protein n=1 Tax=Vibrio vulnificus TaxID=672 RepID=UPI00102A66C6|nr:hypothetical protein [Vibrio vulnificus]RZP85487.1 hypothetical protein D8T54_23075 [Vibrio vulnificus]
MDGLLTFFVGLMLGVSSVAAQEITFSWSGVVPVASSQLESPVVISYSHVEIDELFSSKQESHPQLTMSFLTHKATNTEIKILKTEL